MRILRAEPVHRRNFRGAVGYPLPRSRGHRGRRETPSGIKRHVADTISHLFDFWGQLVPGSFDLRLSGTLRGPYSCSATPKTPVSNLFSALYDHLHLVQDSADRDHVQKNH